MCNPAALQLSGELFMEEQSYRARCISEDAEALNLDCYLLQSQQPHQLHHNRCASIGWSLSTPFATHVRKVSHEQPQVPPSRPVSDTSSVVDEEEGCIPLSEFDFGAASGLIKPSPLNSKRRRRSSGHLELTEDCHSHTTLSSQQGSKKRRRLTLRNRALVAEDFDQILTQIF